MNENTGRAQGTSHLLLVPLISDTVKTDVTYILPSNWIALSKGFDYGNLNQYQFDIISGCQGESVIAQQRNGAQTSRAFSILQAITGNVEKQGTWIRTTNLKLTNLRVPEPEVEPIGKKDFPVFHELWGRVSPYTQANLFPRAVLEGKPYPMKALIGST